MPDPQRRLILANGEKYVMPDSKVSSGRPPEMPRSYGQARDLMRREMRAALDRFAALPPRQRYADEAVMCFRLHPDMTAKTYDPRPFSQQSPIFQMWARVTTGSLWLPLRRPSA